jgi:hypothetical protein
LYFPQVLAHFIAPAFVFLRCPAFLWMPSGYEISYRRRWLGKTLIGKARSADRDGVTAPPWRQAGSPRKTMKFVGPTRGKALLGAREGGFDETVLIGLRSRCWWSGRSCGRLVELVKRISHNEAPALDRLPRGHIWHRSHRVSSDCHEDRRSPRAKAEVLRGRRLETLRRQAMVQQRSHWPRFGQEYCAFAAGLERRQWRP